jgi:hypothetical protein
MHAVPERVPFLKVLGGDVLDESQLLACMATYVKDLSNILANIDMFYALNNLDS